MAQATASPEARKPGSRPSYDRVTAPAHTPGQAVRNPYRTGDPFGFGRRDRLDTGVLGVLGIRVDSAAEAAALLLDPEPHALTVLTAREIVVESDRADVEVGLDGEALVLPSPVRCRIAPGALTLRLPRKRPGLARRRPGLDWRRLRKLAAAVGRTAAPGRRS